MNDPHAVAEALGMGVDELADILRREAARELQELASAVVDAEYVPDTSHVSHLLTLIDACEDAYDLTQSGRREGGGVSTKEATSAGVTAPIAPDSSAALRR